jgi:hypothetical protein
MVYYGYHLSFLIKYYMDHNKVGIEFLVM